MMRLAKGKSQIAADMLFDALGMIKSRYPEQWVPVRLDQVAVPGMADGTFSRASIAERVTSKAILALGEDRWGVAATEIGLALQELRALVESEGGTLNMEPWKRQN